MNISYETISRWVHKFGLNYAHRIRKTRKSIWPHWYLDEVFISTGKQRYYLWRAVDQEAEVLDVLVQKRRDKKAAVKLMRRLLRSSELKPKTITTNRLKSYNATLRE